MTGHVIQGKLLIKQDNAEKKTESGIIIPGQEKPKQGEVVVVGKSTDRVKTLVDVGDKVFFAEHAGTVINMEDKEISLDGEYLLIDYTQVLIYKQQ